MDRIQPFITNCILARSFTNPSKPIDDKRLLETLMIQPTDGGLSNRLRKRKVNLLAEDGSLLQVKHENYKTINKNSKVALREYINKARSSSAMARKIANDKKFGTWEELETYLLINDQDLYSSLPKYDQFKPMHEELWCEYMLELLEVKTDPSQGLKLNGEAALQKLSMADYNGSLLKVTKSRNKNLEGIEGLVLWDAQKSFILLCKGKIVDTVKCIPKKGTVFTFEIPINAEESLQYSIMGDRFKYRSSDRAGRKFKARRCDDLLYYINME
ncbi:HBR411Cp [Eremothecium sinecaudum]|uniref:Ribonuclease P protein subunit n=1 Tax=Eremothecium sinecaudum TaxID=45286 RepID=A0A109UY76_9SACH|nr:HBR411Cp [Eremothecium sinecaudum]AMD19312.1 HBR411Cp [Eremothecium sinecaudum]